MGSTPCFCPQKCQVREIIYKGTQGEGLKQRLEKGCQRERERGAAGGCGWGAGRWAVGACNVRGSRGAWPWARRGPGSSRPLYVSNKALIQVQRVQRCRGAARGGRQVTNKPDFYHTVVTLTRTQELGIWGNAGGRYGAPGCDTSALPRERGAGRLIMGRALPLVARAARSGTSTRPTLPRSRSSRPRRATARSS